MPIERFSEDEEAAGPQGGASAGAADSDTSFGKRLLRRLKFPVSLGIAVGVGFLACFLLTAGSERPTAGPSAEGSLLVALEPQVINLAEPGARLDVRIVFEASSPEFCAILRRHDMQLADIAITVVSTKRPDDLDSELDRNRLKRELADAVSQRLRSDTAHITNVYLTRFYYSSN
jgi:flagellar basal body-associated protein FliL